MAIFIIKNGQGAEINRIVADESFVQEHFPGAWEAVAEPPAAPMVPRSITMRQARKALRSAGLLAGVDQAIDSLPEPAKTDARIEWEYSNELERSNQFVATLGAALGLTSQQIDELFVAAKAL